MALNALLDTWTTRKDSSLRYDDDVTKEVKSVIENGIAYLMKELKPGMKEINAFFSGSIKNFKNTFPYFFPANNVRDGEGKLVDPTVL